jgi:hypothetical protein
MSIENIEDVLEEMIASLEVVESRESATEEVFMSCS